MTWVNITFKTLREFNCKTGTAWLLLYNLPDSKDIRKITDTEYRYAFKISETSDYIGNISCLDYNKIIPANTEITLKFKYNS